MMLFSYNNNLMTFRSPHTFSQWVFHMETPEGVSFALQDHTLQKLIDLVIRQISEFDRVSPNYSNAAREEAQSLGLDWRQYISYAIQHQICLRMDGLKTGLCWGGAGDKIHQFMKGLDEKVAEQQSSLIRNVATTLTKAATFLATGKPQEKFGGCATCGGRKTFTGREANLGRAAKLN